MAERTRLANAPDEEHEINRSVFAGKLDQSLEVVWRHLIAPVGILPGVLTGKHGLTARWRYG